MAPKQCGICYIIDQQNRICRISGPWDEFARNNRPEHAPVRLMSGQVIGLSLPQFVQDDATRMLVSSVVASVRLLGRERSIEYRCDSPEEKRFMRMRVSQLDGGLIELCHERLRNEPMKTPFSTHCVPREQEHFSRCSLCNRVEVDGAWLEPDEPALQMLSQPCPVYHGICPICRERVGSG